MPIGRSTAGDLSKERGRGRRLYQRGNLLNRRNQRSQKHESGWRYIQEPKFPAQPSCMTGVRTVIEVFAGVDDVEPSVRIYPAGVIHPTVAPKAECVIDENAGKNTPDGQFAAFAKVKPQRRKTLDFNIRNIGEHQDHASRGHDVASVGKSTIRKRRQNICRMGHGLNKGRGLGLSQSNDRETRTL